MKKLIYISTVLLIVIAACKKNDDLDEAPRLFRPVLKEDLVSEGNWIKASWQAVKGANSYTAEISTDTFKTITASLVADTNYVLFENLKWNQLYQIQVRANSQDSIKNSKFSNLGGIKTPRFPSILLAPTIDDMTDEAVRIRWTNNGAAVTAIKVYKASDSSFIKEVVLTQTDVDNQYRIISGLSGSTEYIIYLYSGTSLRGWDNYTTKQPLSGIIIDLRGIDNNPKVLYDTLSKIASGSTVLLKRGADYTIPSTFTFTNAVSIQTGTGFEGGPARLLLAGNFDASGNIDFLKFENLIIAKDGANYFMNVGNVAKIGELSFEGIKTEGVFDNSFVRLKTSGDEISKLTINNSVIDSFGVGAKYSILFANASSNAKIDKIEVTNSTFYSLYQFIRQDGVTTTTAVIDNCTFDDFINQGGYFINYTTFPTTFEVENTIFGKTGDPENSNWIKSAGAPTLNNCYFTSDCKFSANRIVNTATPPVPLYSGISAYAGTSTDLFTNPAQGNFKIKDAGFTGKSTAGDPIWQL